MDIRIFEEYMLNLLIPALILFMGFIVWDISRKHDAGRFGTFVLFSTLGCGVLGFALKKVIALGAVEVLLCGSVVLKVASR